MTTENQAINQAFIEIKNLRGALTSMDAQLENIQDAIRILEHGQIKLNERITEMERRIENVNK